MNQPSSVREDHQSVPQGLTSDIIRGCSSWRVSDCVAPDSAEEFSEHVDHLITAIEEEFGTTAYYEMNAQGRWVDEETKRFVPYAYVDYPVIDPSMGSAWGRMDWPTLPGIETVPHPFASVTILAPSHTPVSPDTPTGGDAA